MRRIELVEVKATVKSCFFRNNLNRNHHHNVDHHHQVQRKAILRAYVHIRPQLNSLPLHCSLFQAIVGAVSSSFCDPQSIMVNLNSIIIKTIRKISINNIDIE